MTFTTLISTEELAAHTAPVVIIDCRFALDDTEWGRREYSSRHIPHAVYAHLDADLAGPKTGTNGRHPLPDADVLRRTLGGLGIADGVQVVAYDQDSGMYASRLWWLLRWMGHDAVAVLDGGFAKWLAENRPTSSGLETNTPGNFTGNPRADFVMDADAIAALSGNDAWRIVDARAPERFRGDVEPLDRVAGHIPGAVNHFYKDNLTEAGTYKLPHELELLIEKHIGQVEPDHIVCYCGSGVTACHNLLALARAGLRGARLYPGSWSEWSSNPARPVEKSTL
jgi:thiosulfate/3-mercaptopyruvate sulfurtransferase